MNKEVSDNNLTALETMTGKGRRKKVTNIKFKEQKLKNMAISQHHKHKI